MRLVVLEDGTAVHAGKLVGPGDNGPQHRLQIERRADRLPDLAQRLEFSYRSRQLRGPRVEFREEPHILDRNHRLIGEGLEQRDLLVMERSWFWPADGD